MKPKVRVFAPATVANLGPGFDVLGLALQSPGDLLEAELSDRPGVEIVSVTGEGGLLSLDPAINVAGRSAADVLRCAVEKGAAGGVGVRLWLHKQMPLASGLGSSGASSAAGAFAVNELLDHPLSQIEIVLSAMEGERAASGSAHADNVAPSVMGGIVLVRSYHPFEIVALPVPADLWVSVVHPHCQVSTSEARRLVNSQKYPIEQIVPNLGNIAAFVAALSLGDLALLGRSIDDRLIEPLRERLIPGFRAVKQSAVASGALGSSIAGSGPSVFAFSSGEAVARKVGSAMQAAFRSAANLDSDAYVGTVN